MNYSLAGWLNLLVLLIILGPYILNSLNRKYLKTKNKSFLNLVKILRKIHKPLGLVLIVLGAAMVIWPSEDLGILEPILYFHPDNS